MMSKIQISKYTSKKKITMYGDTSSMSVHSNGKREE